MNHSGSLVPEIPVALSPTIHNRWIVWVHCLPSAEARRLLLGQGIGSVEPCVLGITVEFQIGIIRRRARHPGSSTGGDLLR